MSQRLGRRELIAKLLQIVGASADARTLAENDRQLSGNLSYIELELDRIQATAHRVLDTLEHLEQDVEN